MSTISIRNAGEKDFSELIKLFKEFAIFEECEDKMINSVAQMNAEKHYFNGFVAHTNDNTIIGYATYFFSYHTWVGKSLYMDDLFVKEAFRKNGVGKRLIDAVIQLAKEENCNRVRWQVSNWNKNAQEFYKKIGANISDVELNCDLILK